MRVYALSRIANPLYSCATKKKQVYYVHLPGSLLTYGWEDHKENHQGCAQGRENLK
jgi:hypothetical protein